MLNLQLTEAQISKIGCPQIINITDQLPVNKNYSWSGLRVLNKLPAKRELDDLTTPILHHDAWPKKNRAGVDDITFAKEIAEDHIKLTKNEKLGDAGFPYHLWIRNGQIYQTNDILDFTYGVSNCNGYTVHICVSGDYFSYDTLTDPDRKALYGAIIAVISALPSYKEIKGHDELQAKNCPGYDENIVKEDIAKLQYTLSHSETWEARKLKLGNINNQINYMDSLVTKGEADGGASWALHWKEQVYEIMKSQKLL